MVIIGITGAIGHGKSTLAEALLRAEPNSVHLESFYVIAEVCQELLKHLKDVPADNDLNAINEWLNHLPDILEKVTHLVPKPEPPRLTAEQVAAMPVEYEKLFTQFAAFRQQPDLLQQEITNDNKPSYRPFLQWVGGYVTTRIDARIWYQELTRRADAAARDGRVLATIGGLRFPNDAAVIREAGGIVIRIERPDAPRPDMPDPTERERESIQADCTVINDGNLDQLQAVANAIVTDIRAGQLKTGYQASLA